MIEADKWWEGLTNTEKKLVHRFYKLSKTFEQMEEEIRQAQIVTQEDLNKTITI